MLWNPIEYLCISYIKKKICKRNKKRIFVCFCFHRSSSRNHPCYVLTVWAWFPHPGTSWLLLSSRYGNLRIRTVVSILNPSVVFSKDRDVTFQTKKKDNEQDVKMMFVLFVCDLLNGIRWKTEKKLNMLNRCTLNRFFWTCYDMSHFCNCCWFEDEPKAFNES